MKPVEIRVKNFLSYKDERMTFPEYPNVICVTGLNGDGKSSLVVDSILCALFAEARGEDTKLDAMIRDGEKEAFVSFTFEVGGKRYRLQRILHQTSSRNRRIFEEWNGHAWTNPVTADGEVKRALHRLLPYSYTTFIHTAFVLQGQTDRFLARKKPDERQETMREVLSLIGYDERAAVARELRLQAEREATGHTKQAELLRADARKRREAAEAKIRTYSAKHTELSRTEGPLREALEKAAQLVATKGQARGQYRQAYAELKSATRAWRTNLGQHDEAASELAALQKLAASREELAAAADLYQDAERSAAEWEKLRQEIAGLEQQVELTRTRARVDDQLLNQQLRETQSKLADLEAKIEQGREARQLIPQLEAVLADCDTQVELEEQRKPIAPELRDLQKNIKHIQTEDGPCPFCLQELQGRSREEALARMQSRASQLQETDAGLAAELAQVKERVHAALAALRLKDRRQVDVALSEAEKVASAGEQAQLDRPAAVERVEALQRQIEDAHRRLAAEVAPLDNELAELIYDKLAHQNSQRQMDENLASFEEYRRLEGELARLPVLEERVKGLNALVRAEASRRLSVARQAVERRKAAQGYDTATKEKAKAEEDHKQILGQIQQAIAEVTTGKNALSECAADEKRASKLEADANTLLRRGRLLSVLEEAYRPDGVPALIIQEAMPSLRAKANALLERWTGGRIVIDERPDAAVPGKRSRGSLADLQFHIWDMDSDSARPYALYSGGERFRVDMALRIALSQLLAERAGSPVQMLVIDEGFGTQDPDGLQKMIQIIHDLRKDFHSIIVISHIEEIKRMGYDRMIRIVKEEGISRINEGA